MSRLTDARGELERYERSENMNEEFLKNMEGGTR